MRRNRATSGASLRWVMVVVVSSRVFVRVLYSRYEAVSGSAKLLLMYIMAVNCMKCMIPMMVLNNLSL